jgi:hypothetical protein
MLAALRTSAEAQQVQPAAELARTSAESPVERFSIAADSDSFLQQRAEALQRLAAAAEKLACESARRSRLQLEPLPLAVGLPSGLQLTVVRSAEASRSLGSSSVVVVPVEQATVSSAEQHRRQRRGAIRSTEVVPNFTSIRTVSSM